jgi:hypothetical protein
LGGSRRLQIQVVALMSPDVFDLVVPRKSPDAGTVRIEFRLTRSIIQDCTLEGATFLLRSEDGFSFLFSAPADGPESFTMHATSRGEPISVARIDWFLGGGPDLLMPPLDAVGRRRMLAEFLGVEPAQVASPAAVAAVNGSDSAAYITGFFAEVDDHSGLGVDLGVMVCVLERLRERLDLRVEALKKVLNKTLQLDDFGRPMGGTVPSKAVPNLKQAGLAVDLVRSLASRQLNAMQKWFGQAGNLDMDALRAAFEIFAAGDLEGCNFTSIALTWPSQPDSAALFFWAEFALVVLELEGTAGLEVEAWRPILGVLIGIEPIYSRAYGFKGSECDPPKQAPPARLRFEDYGPPRLPVSVLQDTKWLGALRAAHADPTAPLALMHAAHALRAFPGGIT